MNSCATRLPFSLPCCHRTRWKGWSFSILLFHLCWFVFIALAFASDQNFAFLFIPQAEQLIWPTSSSVCSVLCARAYVSSSWILLWPHLPPLQLAGSLQMQPFWPLASLQQKVLLFSQVFSQLLAPQIHLQDKSLNFQPFPFNSLWRHLLWLQPP